MEKISLKKIIINLVKLCSIMAFVMLCSQVSGSNNTYTWISVVIGAMSFWFLDIGIDKKQAPFIIILLFLLIGISNRLAIFNHILGLFINFLTAFLLTYIPSSNPEYKLYMTFILGFIFNQSNPAVGHDFFTRMLSLFVGGVMIAIIYVFRHSKSDKKYNTIQEVFKTIDITSDRFVLSFKMALGVSIAMLIGSLLGLKRTMWIAISVMSLTQIDFKETKSRFKYRIISTIIGAITFAIVFQLLVPAKYEFIVLFIINYIYSFMTKYQYQIICITMSSLSSAILLFDAKTAIGLRIMLIIVGCIISYIINRIDFKKYFKSLLDVRNSNKQRKNKLKVVET